MNDVKKAALKAAGFRVGSAEEFLDRDQDRLWLAGRLIHSLADKITEFFPLESALDEGTMEDLRKWQQMEVDG